MDREDDFMLYGWICWGEKAALERTEILHAPFLKVTLYQGRAEALTRRRVRQAGRKLRKLGITQVVLPGNFPYREFLEKEGVFPVGTLSLRSEIAADWVRAALAGKGMAPSGVKVAVRAESLTAEVVRTVTELSLRHRFVGLSVPRGGEELGRRLRREYGVSLGLDSGTVERAEAVVEFTPSEKAGSLLTLRLWDETQPLPALLLPPGQEEALPADADRGQLIAALRRSGAVKQVSVAAAEGIISGS